jgi:hypothetical protein
MRIFTTHYTLGTHRVTGVGLGVNSDDLDDALAGSVAEVVFDDAGHDEIAKLLVGLVDTDFAQDNLSALLGYEREPEDWRVGEALAEHYLSTNHACHFPWPDGRDERKRGSSLPGADLVGFQRVEETDRFAFGEVKTSSENTYPPGVAYGRHGLKKQLEDLRDHQSIRDDLVKYLGHRAVRSTWQEQYCSAAKVYLRDPCDVRIFGLLIRDVPPHEQDLSARVSSLAQGCPSSTVVKLFGLYLPLGKIATLGATVMVSRQQGGAQ